MSNVECRIGRLVGCGPAKRGSWIGYLVAVLAIVGAIDDVRAQPSDGACCLPNGTCTVTNDPFVCNQQNGIFRDGATCADVICTGACCLPNGSCTSGSSQSCTSAAGEFKGFGSLCGNQVCGGACCLADKSCAETGSGNCTSLNGLFQGLGTLCEDACPSRLTTAFTYQGQLKLGGVPVADTVNLDFSLWTLAIGGTQLGSTRSFSSVEVVNGLFQVELDFGPIAFLGNRRWLQVAVDGTLLSPRQPLTATPYALQTRGIVVMDDGKVGIGTTTPAQSLHVAGAQSALVLESSGSNAYAWTEYATDARAWHTGVGGSAVINGLNGKFYIWDANVQQPRMVVNTIGNVGIGTTAPANRLSVSGQADFSGNVGIGTTSPTAKLDVRGDIRLGSTGQYRPAASSEEALRIVRGIVWFDGSIITGSGFQVTHPSAGHYTITFNTPFAGTPVVTATTDVDGNVPSFAMMEGASASSVNVAVALPGSNSAAANRTFHFIAIGPR